MLLSTNAKKIQESEIRMNKKTEVTINESASSVVLIDAGVEYLHLQFYRSDGSSAEKTLVRDLTIKNNDEITSLFRGNNVYAEIDALDQDSADGPSIYITGKLADITRAALGKGEVIIPAASLWASALRLLRQHDGPLQTLGIIDLSASGYNIICIDHDGKLREDSLIVNPKCGAGSGVNLSRILQKLDIEREEVDILLKEYLGGEGAEKRQNINVRSDRCGVFSSSATISDKNQGIPLDHALAVTMKSEVMKPCNKIPEGIDVVYLTGGVFRWQYARDCAEDILKGKGINEIHYDEDKTIIIEGMKYLTTLLHNRFRPREEQKLKKVKALIELPSYESVKKRYEEESLYFRFADNSVRAMDNTMIQNMPVNMALDIGSTMAKMVVTNAENGDILFTDSYENHGDTIQTVKHIFSDLRAQGIERLNVQNMGLTGSGRYQVQKAIGAIYPHLKDRIYVLVENYAHARGAISYAKEHIKKLEEQGVGPVNNEFCLLIDIGGEDTKVSIISLEKEELFDNAMNVKCSAGTGSLMDTLKAMFGIDNVAEAYNMAFTADKAYRINATCAVFLMENARKMQAEGFPRGEILASCTHAIVENMARTLWDQVDFPRNAVALLHGQTMLSDPLPLAVTDRIQGYTGSKTYCIVPPLPGHRACLGLIKTMEDMKLPLIQDYSILSDLIDFSYEKRLFVCRGAACGDKNAVCSRTLLTAELGSGDIKLRLGGCTAVNEMEARLDKGKKADTPDAYRDIWRFIDGKMPRSDEAKRLVIPRSFAVSEQAYFLGRILYHLDFPVHIDNVTEKDILEGQPLFPIDSCAPNIGATGQFMRLAREEEGMILIPQIDFLNSGQTSLGRTCTTNQGGPLIALHFAEKHYPEAHFHVMELNLNKDDPAYLADQMHERMEAVFEWYGRKIPKADVLAAIRKAQAEFRQLHDDVAEMTADFIQFAIDNKRNISIVTGREYILNPGIYDSHVGKLLKDKGIVALPSYVFETHLDEQFNYIYWRNPHDILSKIYAITRKELHASVINERLKKLIKQIESGVGETLISIVTVSTFRCGPDSVTLPVINEIARDYPSLLIQSDAMIAELAHLENRVNTHINQLEKRLHNEIDRDEEIHFDLKILNNIFLDALNPENDVLYFPTLDDNRMMISVFRAMGVTVIDNFDDDTYNLEEKAKMGRKYMGDSVCVPLAAVHTDMINAIEDFIKKKKDNDPAVEGKNRVVLFMHGGDGPCRLGQYVHLYKISFDRLFGPRSSGDSDKKGTNIRLIENVSSSLLGKDDFTAEVEKWVGIQAYQSLILQGLFHSMYLRAASQCTTPEKFQAMVDDYRKLKMEIFHRLEHKVKPGKIATAFVDGVSKMIPPLGGPALYFAFGLYNNNGFRKLLKKFRKKWIKETGSGKRNIRIHVDGEIYMRVAQLNEILLSVIDALGYGNFELSYSPIWIFFENVLEARILVANRDIEHFRHEILATDNEEEKQKLMKLIDDRELIKKDTERTIGNFRNILAAPLYKAAGLPMSHPMKKVFAAAKSVLPTFKPFGELVPYTGETILNIRDGVDLVLNVAPEGCMVSSMGQLLTPKIVSEGGNPAAMVQNLFSMDGEINEEILQLVILKILGPEGYYRR